MSRYAKRVDSNTVVEYGFDRAPFSGYFFSVEQDGEVVEAGDTRSAMVCHENEEQMNRSEIVEKLREYGVRQDHVEAMAMDQPF